MHILGWLSPRMYTGIRADVGKVIVLAGIVTTICFSVVSKYAYDSYREAHLKQTKYLLETIVVAASEELANELFSGQAVSMFSVLQGIEKSKNIFSVQVFKADGNLWVNAGELRRQRMMKAEMSQLDGGALFLTKNSSNQEAVVYTSKISFAGEHFGYIEIYYSLSEFNRYMANMVILFVSVLLVVFLVVFVLLNVIMSRVVVRPVLRLREAMVDFDQKNWGQQFEITRDNEIGDMYQAFNTMSAKLDHNYSKLQQASQDLIDEMKRRKEAQEAMKSLEEELEIRQREKLAAELHDGLGQSLQAANLGMKMMNARIRQGEDIVPSDIQKILGEIGISIAHLRHITTELRPVLLDRMSLIEAIRSHCQKLISYTGINIKTDLCDDAFTLLRRQKEQVFLIFQEALNNALKHSRSDEINVSLKKTDDDYLHMSVQDYGGGLGGQESEDGIGLSLMKERAIVLGGVLDITSDGKGTCIRLRVKVDDANYSG